MESSLRAAVCSSRWGYDKYARKATLNPKPNAFGPCVANVSEICNISPEHAGVQAEVSGMETWVFCGSSKNSNHNIQNNNNMIVTIVIIAIIARIIVNKSR